IGDGGDGLGCSAVEQASAEQWPRLVSRPLHGVEGESHAVRGLLEETESGEVLDPLDDLILAPAAGLLEEAGVARPAEDGCRAEKLALQVSQLVPARLEVAGHAGCRRAAARFDGLGGEERNPSRP